MRVLEGQEQCKEQDQRKCRTHTQRRAPVQTPGSPRRTRGRKNKVMLVRQSSRALHVVTPGLRQFSEHHGKRKAMKILPAGGDPAKVRRGKAGELAIPAAKSFIYIYMYIYIYIILSLPPLFILYVRRDVFIVATCLNLFGRVY